MAPFDAPAAEVWADPPPPVDVQAFKDALAKLAGGVAIVACWDGVAPRGLLVSSITGLSVDPPRLLFCVRKEASSHDALLAAGHCSIAILSDTDHEEAQRFASAARAGERFGARWALTRSLAPAYRGGLVSLQARVERRLDGHSHSIFIVEPVALVQAPGLPLIAFERALVSIAA